MTKFIAIDGRGGSGKTHISNLLAKSLRATVFHLDEFGDDFQPFVGIPALINKLNKVDDEIVIYEGVGVFDSRFDPFKPFRIFVSTPDNVRSDRAASRDIPRSDRTAEDWRKIYEIWKTAETAYFTPNLEQSAHLILNNETSADIQSILDELNLFWSESKPKKLDG